MYIKDDIAYADDPTPILYVSSAHPLKGYKLQVTFSDGMRHAVDMTPLLDNPAFAPLRDKAAFDDVYVEYGVPMWCDGEIDIAPEWLRKNGQPIEQSG